MTRYGLIAGNGRFPLLALESARQLGHEITVIAIQEEASREVETLAGRCHWISLGQLGKLIDICKRDGITEVMMCGQVKHAKIFSSIAADWRLLKLLATLPSKNTDGLIGGVVKILADEGIQLRDSTMVERVTLLPNERPFEFVQSVVRGDRCTIVLDLVKPGAATTNPQAGALRLSTV